MQDAIDLVNRGDVQIISEYITKARQNERWAKFFEYMMTHDCSNEYDVHTCDLLNDRRYDPTYLCVLIEKAMRNAERTGASL